MPRIHAPELDGAIAWLNSDGPLRMADLRGQVVILDFWTYCCINCMHVLPTLRMLEERYARDPLLVIGVHSAKFNGEKDPARIAEAVARYEVRHPVAVDSGMRIWGAYAVRSWPTLVIVRPDGTIAAVAPGEPDPEMLSAFVGKLLDEARADGTLARGPRAPATIAHSDGRALFFPGKAVAAPDGRLAIADSGHHRILVTDGEGRVLVTVGGGRGFADGDLAGARFDDPQGLAWQGEAIWVADTRNHALRRIDLAAATVATMAGSGALGAGRPPVGEAPGREVDLRSPWDLLLDGDSLYVAMAGSHQLWRYRVGAGTIGPFAGSGAESLDDGPLDQATFAQPSGLALDGDRRILYVADSETSAVRAVDLARGTVATRVGEGLFDFGDVDGPPARARLQHCLGVAFGAQGLVVADTYNHKLKRIGDEVKTLYAARGPLALDEPGGIGYLPDGRLLVADTNHHRLLAIDSDGDAREIAIRGAPATSAGATPTAVGSPDPAPAARGTVGGWFTTVLELPDEAALAPGAARVVLDLIAATGTELAAGSPIEVAVEVSRRSDLLLLPSATARIEAAGGASSRIEIRCEVRALPETTVDSELVATIDFVACDPSTHACTPGRSMLRIPLRLGRRGASALTFRVALPKTS